MKRASCMLVVLACGSFCWAHGARHDTFAAGTGIRATYDDGSPMAFCEVTVQALGRRETRPYQTGLTDPHGCFAFVPDTNGTWQVRVDDGMGHVLQTAIDVGAEAVAPAGHAAAHPHLSDAIVGLSVIFGLFGIWALWRQRRRCGEGSGSSCISPKE